MEVRKGCALVLRSGDTIGSLVQMEVVWYKVKVQERTKVDGWCGVMSHSVLRHCSPFLACDGDLKRGQIL